MTLAPTSRETADVEAQVLLDHIIFPTDNEPAFTFRVIEFVSEALNFSWKLHIYHPQSSGKVETANGLIKQANQALHWTTLSWPSLVPTALTCLRVTPRSPTGLSPFELLYGRPFLLNHQLPAQTPPLAGHLPCLFLLRSLLCSHADGYLPASTPMGQTAPEPALLSPGDRVLLKQLAPKSLQPWWTGPYAVIRATPSAAELLGHPCWYLVPPLQA